MQYLYKHHILRCFFFSLSLFLQSDRFSFFVLQSALYELLSESSPRVQMSFSLLKCCAHIQCLLHTASTLSGVYQHCICTLLNPYTARTRTSISLELMRAILKNPELVSTRLLFSDYFLLYENVLFNVHSYSKSDQSHVVNLVSTANEFCFYNYMFLTNISSAYCSLNCMYEDFSI